MTLDNIYTVSQKLKENPPFLKSTWNPHQKVVFTSLGSNWEWSDHSGPALPPPPWSNLLLRRPHFSFETSQPSHKGQRPKTDGLTSPNTQKTPITEVCKEEIKRLKPLHLLMRMSMEATMNTIPRDSSG